MSQGITKNTQENYSSKKMHDLLQAWSNPHVAPSVHFSFLRSKLFGKDEEGAIHALAYLCIPGMCM